MEFTAFATTGDNPYMIMSICEPSMIRFVLGKFREESLQALNNGDYTKAERYLTAANKIADALAEIEKGKEES